ncbi:MAG: hypothetical protein ABR898_08850 [Terracidiphilus sp.]
MGPIGHFSVGMAAKRFAPQAPLGILLLATFLLDLLAVAFGYAGIESAEKGIPWSHGLFMSVCWSVAVALLVQRIFRSLRAGVVAGLMVFSHWILDLISHPIPFNTFSFRTWHWDYGRPMLPDLPLLFHGSPVVGFGLYNHIGAVQATVLEVVTFLLGTAVYVDYRLRVRRKCRQNHDGPAAVSGV